MIWADRDKEYNDSKQSPLARLVRCETNQLLIVMCTQNFGTFFGFKNLSTFFVGSCSMAAGCWWATCHQAGRKVLVLEAHSVCGGCVT